MLYQRIPLTNKLYRYVYISIKGEKFHLCRFNIKIQVNSWRNNKSLIIPVPIGRVNILLLKLIYITSWRQRSSLLNEINVIRSLVIYSAVGVSIDAEILLLKFTYLK